MARIIITIIERAYCPLCGSRWRNLEAKDGHIFCPICETEICTS